MIILFEEANLIKIYFQSIIMSNRKEKYYDWYRAFLQMLMSRGVMTGQDVYKGVKSICETYKTARDFPSSLNTNNREEMAEMVELFVEETNKALEKIQMQVMTTREEVKIDGQYTQYYVLAPSYENEIAKQQKNYAEPELEWLKIVAEHLVYSSADKLGTETELINLCRKGGNNSTKKKLQITDADKALKAFVDSGYLFTVRTGKKTWKFGLGPRFLAEMDGWMKSTFEDDVWCCAKCGKVIMIGIMNYYKLRMLRHNFLTNIGVQCTKKGCGVRFHNYCVDTGSSPKCSKCKTPLKIEGVASKRS